MYVDLEARKQLITVQSLVTRCN